MKEVSNNIVALLTVVLIIMLLLEFSLFYNKYLKNITYEAVGLVGLCVDNNPQILPIEPQTAYVNKLFYYDVNTTIQGDVNVTFFDNTHLFDINSRTGVIFFTPQMGQEGTYHINISVFSNCDRLSDSKIMVLTIKYENQPPILDPIPDFTINQSELFIYDVNASDPDGDTLFFGDNTTMFQIHSRTGIIYFIPKQQDVGNHSVLIWVIDGRGGIDWQVVKFEIIDVNDPPELHRIGAQTAIINKTYIYDVNATDVDVKPEWNNLSFYDNATFFEINRTTGLINFTPSDEMKGTYWINISVTDGEYWDSEVISFSIVESNRPPNITSWYPENYTIEINEGQSAYFNITKYDPDGTIPSTQWYLNGRELKDETNDEYIFYTGYTSAGTHNITVIISDGELTDSHEWRVIVHDVPLPPSPPSPPSGPPPTKPPCKEDWRCTEWSTCPIYEIQTRTCVDINNCGTTYEKPEETRKCTYTPEANCSDGIINCHHGGCEIWIDCGGPCPPCATCSDGIKNCHRMSNRVILCEEDVDCGGPCPPCEIKEEISSVCGNFICEKGEITSCLLDCGFIFGQFFLIIILIGSASIAITRIYAIILMVYRKKIRPPPYTNIQILTILTLRKLHLIQLELGKKPIKIIISEFANVIRDFFAKAFDIEKKFTYIELAEVARTKKIETNVANKIGEFAIKMTEIEYGREEPTLSEIASAIKLAIWIVENVSKIKLYEAFEKRADQQIEKMEKVLKEEIVEEKEEKKYKPTEEDKAKIEEIIKLVEEGERGLANHKVEEAESIYMKIREIYNSLPDEMKIRIYDETIRIIKLYNRIVKAIQEKHEQKNN
ncbi:MAG: hypothetical protein QW051_00510 [Candidatus Aenigmatarchaeota archaeon]